MDNDSARPEMTSEYLTEAAARASIERFNETVRNVLAGTASAEELSRWGVEPTARPTATPVPDKRRLAVDVLVEQGATEAEALRAVLEDEAGVLAEHADAIEQRRKTAVQAEHERAERDFDRSPAGRLALNERLRAEEAVRARLDEAATRLLRAEGIPEKMVEQMSFEEKTSAAGVVAAPPSEHVAHDGSGTRFVSDGSSASENLRAAGGSDRGGHVPPSQAVEEANRRNIEAAREALGS